MAEHIKHIIVEDLLARQAAAESSMLEEFSGGEFTIDNPLIRLNPYFISPCAAVALFKTVKETAVTVTVRGKTPEGDISHTYPAAAVHILPILGLYPGYDNTVDIELYQGAKKTVTITTEPAIGAAELDYMRTTAAHLKDNLIIVTPAGFGRLTGFDYSGSIRWYINIGLQMGVKRLKNGHLLVSTDRMIRAPYYSTGLYELDFTGKIYAEYQIPGGYHHDQMEMPSGDLLILSDDFNENSHTVEDVCVLVDRDTGAIKRSWDFKTFLTPGEGASGLSTDEDWFHCNALWYDDKTRSLTFSGRHMDALVNIDFDTGALRWILGDPESWPEDKQKYFFKPENGSAFSWQYAQHACLITPGGDVMCFDNGTLRSKNKERYLKNKDNFSRGVRFHINTEDMTIRQVWEYGRERGSSFFSQHISNVDYFADGHYLIHSGGIMLVDGEPPEGLMLPGPDNKVVSECVTVELLRDEVVLELKCRSNYYRALKLPLYDDNSGLKPAAGKKLGALAATVKTEMSMPVLCGAAASPVIQSGLLPESCLAHIIEESDRLSLKARFDKGSSVTLLLAQGKTLSGYAVNTDDKFASFSCLPYIEADEKNTSTTVNKAGLSGAYEVMVMIGDNLYDTGVVVTC